jgi:DNA uptake protein ComE-like DNA-binding protein
MPGAVIPVAAPLPAPGGGADADADDRLNVNLATLDELVALEGVGITIARRVQEVQGSIESIEDLIEVSSRPNWLELAPSLRFD